MISVSIKLTQFEKSESKDTYFLREFSKLEPILKLKIIHFFRAIRTFLLQRVLCFPFIANEFEREKFHAFSEKKTTQHISDSLRSFTLLKQKLTKNEEDVVFNQGRQLLQVGENDQLVGRIFLQGLLNQLSALLSHCILSGS